MKEITEQLCEGVQLVRMTEPKFKTSHITIVMLLPAEPEHYAEWNLAHSLLLHSCEKYPSIAAMAQKLQELYGANVGGSIAVSGNVFRLHFSMNAIADAYALQKEAICRQSADFLMECLLHPLLEGEAFSEQAFRTELQDLLDVIDSEINHKQAYAAKKLKEIAYAGELEAYTCYGTKEQALALTPASVYKAYQQLLKKAEILIYYIGPEDAPELSGLFRHAFAPRACVTLLPQLPSPCKSEVRTVREQMDVNQCQLMLAYKSNANPTQEQLKITSLLLGGVPFSLLFSNVREKLSLCYYCYSRDSYQKNSMIISAGVSADHLEQAQEAIQAQLECIKQGAFEDVLVENTKSYLRNALQLQGDTPSSCISEAFERYIRADHADIATRMALLEQVTKEDIIRTAASLQLDSVYILEQEG